MINYSIKYACLQTLKFSGYGGPSNAQYSCKRCGKLYRNKTSLSRHVNQECGKIAKHPCHICNKLFKRKDHLTQHIRETHGVVNYK